MSLTVVIGGQYGSEGKGKITSYLALRDDVDTVVRCGGPNSGHTVDIKGRRYELRSLPAGFVNPRSRLLLAPGSLVDPAILLAEIKLTGVDPARVGVDRNAGTISPEDGDEEHRLSLRDRVGSTLSGTGVAVSNRVLRRPTFRLAQDVPELRPFLSDVSDEVNADLDRNHRVIVEGTQGFALSLYHSPHYPYVTSRDTTATAFLSEVGVSPTLVTQIVMCVRTYPIRVAGHSGPLPNELSWDDVRRRSGYPHTIDEYTTTTKRLRRVAQFDIDIVARASRINRPTSIYLHGTDYLSYGNTRAKSYADLDLSARTFVDSLEGTVRVPVLLVGTGPANEDIIDRTQDH